MMLMWLTVRVLKAQIPLYRLPCDVRDKPVTLSLAHPGKFRGSRRYGIWAEGDVTGLSQTCCGRHWEFGIVEFGLYPGWPLATYLENI